MTRKRMLSPEQDMAADPMVNVWVQANAGTGKTSVLIQRLLRILFRTTDSASPGILCLTYTNAGAGEMRNRILSALREWAMADDERLGEMLDGVSANRPATKQDIAHAREIFFKYIDNPDILKIKTIHGFCEEILHRFPLEAGISPAWSLVSDANQRVLLHDAFNRLINTSYGKTDNLTTDAFARIVERTSEYHMDELLDMLSGQYKNFFNIENYDKYRLYFIDTIKEFLELNIPQSDRCLTENLQKIVYMAIEDQKSAKKPVKYLDDIINLTQQYIDTTIDFKKYSSAYLKSDGEIKSPILKKDYLKVEAERVYAISQRAANEQIFTDTVALFDLAAAFARTYRDIKSQHNLLDFEDLILYTRKLFSNPETMGWVLSQLDLSLGHILVDEAQDTSPMQWDILRMLSGDFFVDGDAGKSNHSIFVVGDTKQSIYGFQGADPRAFAASRREIFSNIENNMRTIEEIPLAQSFRSLPPILHTVDMFFGDRELIELTGFSNNKHAYFRRDSGGEVVINSLFSKQETGQGVTGYICTICDKIESMIKSGECVAGDIMILVQNRNPMAAPVVMELKRRGINVAGSDRIVLPNFAPVRDLLNLVRFCMDVTDDYSLCCVLKSPIYRLTERDIFNLCKTRTQNNNTVFETLQSCFPDIYKSLSDIVNASRVMGPYSFFTKVLNNGVRDSMIAALGQQIIDPLEEFITICLAYERTQPGTLRHFIKWFITGGSEVKRDMDAAMGVRVATVHGSKGLESRVVFLIDTVRTPDGDNILPLKTNDGDGPVWLWTASNGMPSMRRRAAEDACASVRIAEYYRLLYVAMTRARDKLYIYGYTPYKNAPEISWHAQLWRVFATDDNQDSIRIGDV